jgi:hypothetical protein
MTREEERKIQEVEDVLDGKLTPWQAVEKLCQLHGNPDYVSRYADPRHELDDSYSSCAWYDINESYATWEEYRPAVIPQSRVARRKGRA